MLQKCIPGWRQIFSLLGFSSEQIHRLILSLLLVLSYNKMTNLPRTSIYSSEIPTGTVDNVWNTGLTSVKAIHVAHTEGWYDSKNQRLWHILWKHAETEELLALLFLDLHQWRGMKYLFFHLPLTNSIPSWFLISIFSSVESAFFQWLCQHHFSNVSR